MASKPTNPSESTRALGAGLTFGITVALFTIGGVWLDGQCETSPLFVIVGVFVGLLGGTIHLLAALAPDVLPFGRKAGKPPADPPSGPAAGPSAARRAALADPTAADPTAADPTAADSTLADPADGESPSNPSSP